MFSSSTNRHMALSHTAALCSLLAVVLSIFPGTTSAITPLQDSGQVLARQNTDIISETPKFLGSSSIGGHVAHANADAAASVGKCTVAVQEARGKAEYDAVFPNQLRYINWEGAGTVGCTQAISRITFTIWAIAPWGQRIPIAESKPCTQCATAKATSTHEYCKQPPIGGKCAGKWKVAYEATLVAPPGLIWTSPSGNCVAAGSVLTCSASANAGTAAPFQSITMPDGYQDRPSLSDLAITGIRNTHFVGGKKYDGRKKGTFLSKVTNDQLQAIFKAGLQDKSAWKRNTDRNWEKTFPYSGVGLKSGVNGGGPSSSITLVITPAGGDVNTMYPS